MLGPSFRRGHQRWERARTHTSRQKGPHTHDDLDIPSAVHLHVWRQRAIPRSQRGCGGRGSEKHRSARPRRRARVVHVRQVSFYYQIVVLLLRLLFRVVFVVRVGLALNDSGGRGRGGGSVLAAIIVIVGASAAVAVSCVSAVLLVVDVAVVVAAGGVVVNAEAASRDRQDSSRRQGLGDVVDESAEPVAVAGPVHAWPARGKGREGNGRRGNDRYEQHYRLTLLSQGSAARSAMRRGDLVAVAQWCCWSVFTAPRCRAPALPVSGCDCVRTGATACARPVRPPGCL